ncbi:type III restriction protein, res subunit [Alkaliphilus metalliredigens QYMF]|uniref:Type III restriction protein, res subunit n=1 Tax=Alkaliphilus metalliredigens (strain QYMF) TaxID=293826 RepID=A6TP39_ALKMQ|nr:DEAD/DEAH box helicase family protein [Alkaliphilus metalliredigens]ABR47957.1 type III restriction protein, res subunit [Alkaliphilus metalliredigens QYMF]
MEYDVLLEKYENLLEENKVLRNENKNLKEQLNIGYSTYNGKHKEVMSIDRNKNIETNRIKVEGTNNYSSPKEKVKLFMSLFKGRSEVYAKRWQNKEGKSGYSPVCLNEWQKGVCNKPQIKCSVCNNKKYALLDEIAIEKHLKGKDILGIYPMLEDESCFFLAMDFDDTGWENDISAIMEICDEKNIPASVERSRSGNGAHIWFFFQEKTSATIARKFGTAILTYAMMKRHEIKFQSYDRLFPNQDTMPKGGLGNLIALPLQLYARKSSNSCFIDTNLSPYDDQWKYLNRVRKLQECDINLIISELGRGNELGVLRTDNDQIPKPWETASVKEKITKTDFPNIIHVIRANGLYIEKEGFSSKSLNVMKRLASFKNSDFYKAQAMRISTYGKPRIISLCDETSEYLCLPRGCEVDLVNLSKEYKIPIEWKDERFYEKTINVEFSGSLREEQEKPVNEMLQFHNGVLSATTAFGKTVIGAKLIAERKLNTLILVHTRQLLEQWKERLGEFLEINEVVPTEEGNKRGRKKQLSAIGQIGAGKNNSHGIIDIAIMQSLVKGDEVKAFIKEYGMVIVDECHHVPAFSFEQIMKNINAKYVYGLTATPIRKDGHHPIIFMQCGPIRYKVDPLKQAIKRPFEHYIIPRFTSFRRSGVENKQDWSIGEIYSDICTSAIRNQFIIEDVLEALRQERNPIILTERTAHVEILAQHLEEKSVNVVTLTGRMSSKKRKVELEKLENLHARNSTVIVATGRLVGEGFDMPKLDTLFLAMPVAWKGTISQYAGRLHRLYESKSEVQIYDYIDIHVNILEKMYQKRLKGYAAIGYSIKSDSNSFNDLNSIFSNNCFLTAFRDDMLATKSGITIVSPYVNKKGLEQILTNLKEIMRKGVKLTVITRPESDYKEKDRFNITCTINDIKKIGGNIVRKSNIHQKFAVMDQRIVWYGGINLLSSNNSDGSIIRLDNLNIADELLCSIDI